MQRVDLKDGWFMDLDIDKSSFTVKYGIQIKKNEDGKEYEFCTKQWFFGSFESAIKKVIKEKAKEGIDGTIELEEYLAKYQGIIEVIQSIKI